MKLQYSKVLVFISGLIFLLTLAFCAMQDVSGIYDTSIYATAITITGGVFGSAIIWYEKKSQAENVAKIQTQQVKDIAEIEFGIYERKVKLQKELGILGEPDIGMDEEGITHADEQLENAINRAQNYLDGKMDDASIEPEIQTY